MTYKEFSTVIGFSAFNIFEECYEYKVTIVEIMNDYGVSCGECDPVSGNAIRR